MLERNGAGNHSVDRKKGKYYIKGNGGGTDPRRFDVENKLLNEKSTQSFPDFFLRLIGKSSIFIAKHYIVNGLAQSYL